MTDRIRASRSLPANVKSIAKAARHSRIGDRPVEYRIEGTRGLVLNVMPSGTSTWYFHYDIVEGRTRRRRKLKLGRLDDLPLADAIAKAAELRIAVRDGGDPAGERASITSAQTFAELLDARISTGPPLRATSEQEYRHLMRHDVLPVIGRLPAVDVDRDHVIAILDAITARGATRRADSARAMISSVFAFGLDRGLVQDNPVKGMRNRHAYQPRDVVLTAVQIRQLWNALESGEAIGTLAMARILKLALLTGQRRAEIASTRLDDLELNDADPCLVITRGRAKNNNQHRVPLSPQALAEFRHAVAEVDHGLYVFPNPKGTGHILPRSVSKAMERNRQKLGLGNIRVHDLRRTVGSMMARYGVPTDIRERVLNHGGTRSGSITVSVYSWYDYAAEKRAALELWADALACILKGGHGEVEGYSVRLATLKGASKVLVS